jgi:hypothetical protein
MWHGKVALSAERVLTLFVAVGLLTNCIFDRILKTVPPSPHRK